MNTRSSRSAILMTAAILLGLVIQPVNGAELVNGDFEAGLDGWTVDGAVTVEITDGNDGAILTENPQGSKSTIYQAFDLPPHAMAISFAYSVAWYEQPGASEGSGTSDDPPTEHGPVYRYRVPDDIDGAREFPRDSFSAFLLNPDTVERLLPPPDVPPIEFDDFFYAENSGSVQFNEDYVTISDPDEFGVRVVTLDVSSLPEGETVRLEFGLAGGPDGFATMAFVDDVVIALNTPVARCKDLALAVDSTCCATVLVDDIDDGSFDPNGEEDIALICIEEVVDGGNPESPRNGGSNRECVSAIDFCGIDSRTMMLRITDLAGESDSCLAIVALADETAPVVACPEDMEFTVPSGSALPVGDVELFSSATDNCTVDMEVLDNRPEESFSAGTTDLTFSATDQAGNVGSCSMNVLVGQAPPPPAGGGGGGGVVDPLSIACPADAVVGCGDSTEADSLGSATATSGVRITSVEHVDDVAPGEGQATAVITRAWLASDIYGRQESCEQIITVSDVTAPTITCPDPVLWECGESCPDGVDVGEIAIEAEAADACELASVYDDRPGQAYTVGDTTVTFTAVDGVGNESSCTMMVSVTSPPIDEPAPQPVPDPGADPAPESEYHEEVIITTRRTPCGALGVAPLLVCILGFCVTRLRSSRR